MRTARGWTQRAAGGALALLFVPFGFGSAASASPAAASSQPLRHIARVILPSPDEDDTTPVFPAATPIAQAQRWLTRALADRSARLGTLSNEVVSSKGMPQATRATVASLLSADASGMSQLASSVAAAGTIGALNAIAGQMVNNFRIVSLVVPVVQITLSAGAQTGEVSTLSELEPSIEAAITTDQQAGKPVAAAQAVFKDLTTQLAAVLAADSSSTSSVLSLRPSSYSASSGTLNAAENQIAGAAPRLLTARADLTRIVQLLAAPSLNSQPKVRALELR